MSSATNIAAVSDNVAEDLKLLINHHSYNLDLSYDYFWRILYEERPAPTPV